MTHGERFGDHCNQAERLVCRALTRILVERPDDVSLAAPTGAILAGVRLLVQELPHHTSREDVEALVRAIVQDALSTTLRCGDAWF